ncbi:MAG: hypothetical protein SCH71_09880 [Desulfobulbaceae bacterium]|nr:hypothetical protein [Desulfobulbaceae bacterium]
MYSDNSTDQTGIPPASKIYPLPGPDQVKVSFMSVKVAKDGSWGLWSDTCWRFDFSVNGAVRSLNKDVNEDDPSFPVNFNFIVDVSAPGSKLTVQVGGKECDWGNSPLPGSIDVWNGDNNYGFGMHTLSAACRDVSYEVTYRIACVQRKVSTISNPRNLWRIPKNSFRIS